MMANFRMEFTEAMLTVDNIGGLKNELGRSRRVSLHWPRQLDSFPYPR